MSSSISCPPAPFPIGISPVPRLTPPRPALPRPARPLHITNINSLAKCCQLPPVVGAGRVSYSEAGQGGREGASLALTWSLHALHPASGISTGRLGGRAAGAEVSSGGRGGVGADPGRGWGCMAFDVLGGTRRWGVGVYGSLPRPGHTCPRPHMPSHTYLRPHLPAVSPVHDHTCPLLYQSPATPFSATPSAPNLPRGHTHSEASLMTTPAPASLNAGHITPQSHKPSYLTYIISATPSPSENTCTWQHLFRGHICLHTCTVTISVPNLTTS